MPSPSDAPRRFSPLILLRTLLALAMATAPSLVAARMIRAEGPVAVLPAWSAAVVGLAAAAGSAAARKSWLRRLAAVSAAAAAAAGGAGALVVMVQLNVAKRSLAEAWLALARTGEAFGSFSFFASEIVALLSLGPALLALRGRIAPAVAAFAAIALFSQGFLGASAPSLAAAIATAVAVPILASRRIPGGGGIIGRIRSGAVPLGAALALSVAFALLPPDRVPGPVRAVDLTPLVRLVAPAFPLLLDVPGYGYEVGGAELAPSVYLTENVLFEAEADAGGLRYLVAAVYEDWTGTAWREARRPGNAVRTEARQAGGPRPAGALRLRLAEDFYSLVPIERTTEEVVLSRDAPPVRSADSNGGVRFEGSAKRGLAADLLVGARAETDAGAADEPDGRWTDPGPDQSGRIAALSRELALRGETEAGGTADRDRAVAEAILRHFRGNGFSYSTSLRAGGAEGTDLERFLFQDKKGYCVHYATAFVLLARRAGIPARVVEGFRVELGEDGRGAVRGVNAHAWAEAWLGGAWRVVEPTPPFSEADPFSYLAPGDAAARRQLAALFGREAGSARETAGQLPQGDTAAARWAAAAAAVAAAAAFAVLAFSRRRTGDGAAVRAAKRKAARLVARYRARGVGGPEVLGWTGWAAAAKASEPEATTRAGGKDKRGDPDAVAASMIVIAFGTEGGNEDNKNKGRPLRRPHI